MPRRGVGFEHSICSCRTEGEVWGAAFAVCDPEASMGLQAEGMWFFLPAACKNLSEIFIYNRQLAGVG